MPKKRSDRRRAVRKARPRSRQPSAAPAKKPGKIFVMAPFRAESRAEVRESEAIYREGRELFRRMASVKHGGVDLQRILQHFGVAEMKSYGLVLNTLGRFTELMRDPTAGTLFKTIWKLHNSADPSVTRRAQADSLKLIRQLRGLGFQVRVQDYGDRSHALFLRAARGAGAAPFKSERLSNISTGMIWARDQWVKIGGRRVKPRADLRSLLRAGLSGRSGSFGEGGAIVPVGLKNFLIAENLKSDPRVANYEKAGFKFHKMPFGAQFDRALTDLLGFRVFTVSNHLDLFFGAVPERGVLAVDPRYYREHKLSVQLLEDSLKPKKGVFVPEAEADHHPVNFLPLGDGRVLVDCGAPQFIEELRKAGVEVIPTVVPMDAMLENKGGLHCLFNEY
jgi:hypothetical protein